ncbi:Imm71 family immunity protein [Cupriavidus taiwanensis]|uniref:Imm71 family immunity protein n=1 Tax=Cupriavidus taiwanensis TaxID=164546 RepID=UPI0032EEBC0B
MNIRPSHTKKTSRPNDAERRRIFYWFKRISSHTAWKQILGYYENWTFAVENCRQLASKLGFNQGTNDAIRAGKWTRPLVLVTLSEDGISQASPVTAHIRCKKQS